ncbi:family 78 glycoside hydrolase catalytic domain, partial [bacterium]|nr:family 78 glycoside hydrolase catalytic domain [bacterium]
RAILAADKGDVWDSGTIPSGQSIQVVYGGPAPASRHRIYWKVRVWDAQGAPSPWSAIAWWEMGLLDAREWEAKWIGSALVGGRYTTIPCPYLRTEFSVGKPVASARLYVTALGLHECSINGIPVGDDVFVPGWTDYRKRIQYQVYDVTRLVKQGRNALGAILGDGWYCGHVEWRGRQLYGDRPRLLAQLELTSADGTRRTVLSDESWKHAFGPIIESDMLMGESYDARLEMPGWDRPGFDDRSWQPVTVFTPPAAPLVAMPGMPVTRTQELKPVAEPKKDTRQWGRVKWVFDLGQNMTGRVRIRIKGEAGTTITIRHAETLNPDGTIYTTNLRTAKATDYYTFKGNGVETYEPRFTFHGFRYVEITGYKGALKRDAVTGIVLHSAMEFTSSFTCSDPLVNKLVKNIVWGHRGNFVDIPSDCPQRDERLGWTGDAQVFVRTATFDANVASFFTKWLDDLSDSQNAEGAIPPVSPNTNCVGGDGGPAWSDAFIICPWTIYLAYGDTRILERHYEGFKRFITFLATTCKNDIRAYEGYGWQGFGDWLSINADTPKDLIGTAFYAHSADLMSRIARVLGKKADAKTYCDLHARIRDAFIKRYVTADGVVASQTQTAYVLALHFNLLPAALRPAAVEALVHDITRRGTRLSTGFVGSPYLPHVLSGNGRVDVAYELLFQKSWPSWLYAVTQGATTIWERWDGWTHDKGFQDAGMNSFNHYAYGAVGDWLFRRVAGIETDETAPAYKEIVMRPCAQGLSHAAAEYTSVHGTIRSAWRKGRTGLTWDVTIPANTTATLHIPGGAKANITESGAAIGKAKCIRVLKRGAHETVVSAGAGAYSFTVR